VVLLVHGQPGTGHNWEGLARLLAPDHRVIAPDRPGWGLDTSPAAGLADNARILVELLRNAGAKGPVTVVGHSLGGGIALEMALSNPDLVGSLVLIGSVGVGLALSRLDRVLALPAVGGPVIRAGIVATRHSIVTARHLSQTSLLASLAERAGRLPTVRALVWLDSQPINEQARRSFLVEQRALIDETPSLEQRLPSLALPVAVVHGSADRIVPRAATHLLAELIPGAEHVTLRGEGHLVPMERPELIAPLVRRYAAFGSPRPLGADGSRQERLELELGLGEFGGWVGVGDDPHTSEKPGGSAVDDGAANS
jgi:pimeloyl-ACP methyl ester carboxylesterase